MTQDIPTVSACVMTYNHGRYIEECLEGILAQRTKFSIEILIGEDGSSDGTREICLEYATRFPAKIRLLLNDRKNVIYIDGEPTGRWNLINTLSNARGKYIAICEGDDYWVDQYKLQKQVDFLEENPDYTICLHNTWVCRETDDTKKTAAIKDPKIELDLYDFIDLDYFFQKGGLTSRGHTSSVVFRNGLIRDFPDWFSISQSGDLPLFMLIAAHGKGRFFEEFMSHYRKHDAGFTGKECHKPPTIYYNRLEMLENVNKHFDYRFNTLIKSQQNGFRYALFRYYLNEGQMHKALANYFALLGSKQYAMSSTSMIMRVFRAGLRKKFMER